MRAFTVGLFAIVWVWGTPAAQAEPTPLETFAKACADNKIILPDVLPVQDECTRYHLNIILPVLAAPKGATKLTLESAAPPNLPVTSTIRYVGDTRNVRYALDQADNRTLKLAAPLRSAVFDGTLASFGDNTGCNGWRFLGEFAATAHDATSQVAAIFQRQGKARLYEWTKDNTICWYLYRGDGNPPNDNNGNGTLCFNQETCAVCALDTDRPVQAEWTDLIPATQLKVDPSAQACWLCHGAGTIAVKAVPNGTRDRKINFFQIAKDRRMPSLNQTCAAQKKGDPPARAADGPYWVAPSNAWTSATSLGWGKAVHVDAPRECKGCHTNGFVNPKSTLDSVPGTIFCEYIVRPAFHAGGSMFENGHVFSDSAECKQFALKMSCTAAQFNCGP